MCMVTWSPQPATLFVQIEFRIKKTAPEHIHIATRMAITLGLATRSSRLNQSLPDRVAIDVLRVFFSLSILLRCPRREAKPNIFRRFA